MPTRKRGRAASQPITAKGVSVTPLDAEGEPTGPPQKISDATAEVSFTPDDTGIELRFEEAFKLAAEEHDSIGIASIALNKTATATSEFKAEVSPETLAVLRQLVRIPIPTAIIDRWYPAFVRWPDEDQALNLRKVFLTPQGIYVYKRRPATPETFENGAQPDRYAPVDFSKTKKPVVGSVARNAGIPLVTPIGTVIIQPTAGCGCGTSIKHWVPDWVRNSITWEDGVKLATDATEGR